MIGLDNFDYNPLAEENLPSFEIPDLTTATLQTHVPQLGMTWDVGTQLATSDRQPYSRTYNVLSFPDNVFTIDKIDLGAYNADYEGSFYYQVTNTFQEDTYTSKSESDPTNSFLRWRHYRSTYRQELVYAHKVLNTLIWNRPIDPLTTTYQVLPSSYTLPTISVGAALAASIQVTTGSYTATLSNSLDNSTLNVSGQSLFLLSKPTLSITLTNVTALNPIQVVVTFYGQYKWRSFTPIGEQDQPTLIHPLNSSLATKLKPPGLASLPDNFWNSYTLPTVCEQYSARQGATPSWN